MVALVFLTGAQCVRSINTPPLPPGASMEQALAVMEAQSQYVQSIEAPEAKLSVKKGRLSLPSLRTQVAVERPRNMRLVATLLGTDQVDLGSNPELFWFWVRYNSPPGIYYCRHADFEQSPLRQQLPVDLDWVLESIGFGGDHPDEQHLSLRPVGNGRLELRTTRPSPSGMLTKLTYLDANMGWVLEQNLYNGTDGRLIASTVARKHQRDPYTGTLLPGEVTLKWPSADVELTLDLGTIQFNQLRPNPQLFTIPQIQGTPYQNLTEVRLNTQ